MEAEADLQTIFNSYATGPAKEMASKEFNKLVKECKLVDKKFVMNDIDTVFAKVKTKGSKTLTFAQFQAAIDEIAKKKGVDKSQVESVIKKHGAQKFQGTKADYVKFHDDKTTYTGVYARGGPTTVDVGTGGKVSNISEICNREKADVRGVAKKKK